MSDQHYYVPPIVYDPRDPRCKIGPMNPRIVCRDGFEMSVQAQYGLYCLPRLSNVPHTHLEGGFPSSVPILEELKEFAEEKYDENGNSMYTRTVYTYVPRHVFEKEFALHGGIVQGRIPD